MAQQAAKQRPTRLRYDRLPWRLTQEPSIKRNSQSRTEYQKTEPAAPKNLATSEKAQSNQHHCGSPECDQPAAPGTAMKFSFKGCAVRSVLHAGEPWFVTADVCTILALTNSRQKVSNLDENEKGVTNAYTLGGEQKVAIVSESGLYQLIFSSRKPQAKAFRRWVTGTVLPSIRKTGGYQTKDDTRPVGTDGDGGQDALTIVLPGLGRYVATVMPDGAVRVHETEYSALLEEMTLADCRILCHTLHIIEGQWHKYQHRRSIASDRQDEFGLARLEAAILDGSRLAARCLKWHSGFEEERPGL